MATETTVGFRLSIWRPARFTRPLAYHMTEPNANNALYGAFGLDKLHEQIYQWNPAEDVWACFSFADRAQVIHELFFTEFAPNLPPADRNFRRFAEAVQVLDAELAQANSTSWADAMQMEDNGNDQINLRLNSALALTCHLRWIVQVFGRVPGASVAIR